MTLKVTIVDARSSKVIVDKVTTTRASLAAVECPYDLLLEFYKGKKSLGTEYFNKNSSNKSFVDLVSVYNELGNDK